MIHVCSLARLEETVTRTRAQHVVSLVNAGTPMRIPAGLARDGHLFLAMNDIVEVTPGMTPPGEAHVAAYLEYLESWARTGPLVVHCYAGISRSTAAAYIAVAALEPDRDEAELATTLRSLAPSATPNRRLVAIADEILGRGGRMTRAIEAIGRGADAYEGTPFELAFRTAAAAR
ncbi:tyrosine phosphatase family protein [Methylobrevis albus]|uniref:Protein tyrosine phosphatase n=1 Tax=Methylobrevis albus TaxID=2793297 RepID=A0A931N085_9HYPH|nr:protein-tyrosine phosphatase family protein [Methylobrevis albus]MBH0238526.1 protein tyrosine phosphatase [Methylobrevis albus]